MLLAFTAPEALDVARVGGKGFGLARATQAGLPVPDGVILPTDTYRAWFAPHQAHVTALLAENGDAQAQSTAITTYLAAQPLPDVLTAQLNVLQTAHPEHYFAVRSSGSAEDLPGAAFAGLHDTLLNVHGVDALAAAVKQCWLSLWNAEVLPYRERLGVAHESAAMAVVIQQMVDVAADGAAGVAFSIDPVRGEVDTVLINAAFGLGETVVAGEAPVDEYRVDKNGSVSGQSIAAKPQALTRAGTIDLPPAQQTRPAIKPTQAAQIAALARQAEAHFGFPQDIEWAYEGNALYLLQSRPITRFAPRWTRDESAERFPNPVTPLTWGLCEAGFHQSLNYSFALMGLPPLHDPWFSKKDGYIYGNQNAVRVYAGRLPLAPLRNTASLNTFIESGGLARYTWISELPTRWMNDLDHYLLELGRYNAIDYTGKTLAESWRILQDINDLGTAYFLPNIAISLTQTLLYRVLRHVLDLLEPASAQDTFDRLISVVETKTGAVNRAMWQLSRRLRAHPELINTRYHDAESLNTALDAYPDVRDDFAHFLAQHGHREVDFDAYHPTWLEASQTVFTQIQMMASQDDSARDDQYWDKKSAMYASERELLARAPAGLRFFLQELIRLARTYTALDDIEHYQTTRLTLPFRRAARAIGEHLVQQGALDEAMDIYFLPPAELEHAITSGDYHNLRATAAREKTAYQDACARAPAWEYGAADSAPATDGTSSWQGLGGSPGSISGEVFIITDPAQFADFPQGAILVARTTNPAWTPLFYHAAGVITESGGPLSHGAVTARELGIPAVMGIRDACYRLTNGQRVKIDGSLGRVIIL
ncbi:PEP/pyruvate-binding domain-containing protein [uncultured Cardiobacterium sp.]|uniref:PEP/pyruvate-binding domain-containing protein n=1 Tax=uncultured Cardiobacterium sp. TaxID=417619 RepID=UPI00262081BB|nr:PEP/pyruvate-binding domain-containing protein [uncultured Cardiobacterium sp.]